MSEGVLCVRGDRINFVLLEMGFIFRAHCAARGAELNAQIFYCRTVV